MAKQSKTWWGQKFLAALEKSMDSGRLARGRSYSGDNRITSWKLENGKATARVKGNINPYFGVYKTPNYSTTFRLQPITASDWKKVIKHLCSKAGPISQLLLHQMPDSLDVYLAGVNISLLPYGQKDMLTNCSCPDFANPCKHIAGVCFRLATMIDQDPLLIFEMRGLSREKLLQELQKSPLGKALAAGMETMEPELQPVEHYFTQPKTISVTAKVDYESFWQAEKQLPHPFEPLTPGMTAAILAKKAGDYPAFWPKDGSFIAIMEELHERIRTKNKIGY